MTDFNDFLLLQANFGQAVAGTAAPNVTPAEMAFVQGIHALSEVPEPASLFGLSIASGLLLRRQKRN